MFILIDGKPKMEIDNVDIQIGAVELKDSATDSRALISDADTVRATTNHVLSIQSIDATGKVQPAGEVVGNPIYTAVGDGTTTAVVETTGSKKALNVNISDGTNDMPTMDAVTRRGFVGLTDGTNDGAIDPANTARTTATVVQATQIVDATGKVQPAGEVVTNPVFVAIGDGAQTADVEALEADIDGKNALTANSLGYGMETSGTTHPLLCTSGGILRVDTENDAEVATTPVIYNVEMTNLDTQYTQALPSNTKILEFTCRETGFAVRYAFVTGKVATPTAPWKTLKPGETKTIEGLNLTSKTLYFACSTAGKNIEIECWS